MFGFMGELVLLKTHLTANHLKRWCAAHQSIPGKHSAATGADAILFGKISHYPFFKTFNQCAFAAFAIFIQSRFTFGAKDINGFGRAFFIWFSDGFALWVGMKGLTDYKPFYRYDKTRIIPALFFFNHIWSFL